jgi:galactokinase
MGGPGDYSGALVLHASHGGHIAVAAEGRDDDFLLIHLAPSLGRNGETVRVPIAHVRNGTGADVPTIRGNGSAGCDRTAVRAVIGAIAQLSLVAEGQAKIRGMTVAVDSTLEGLNDTGRDAAILAAAVTAAASVWNVTLSLEAAIGICERAALAWLDGFAGRADVACIMGAKASSIMLWSPRGGLHSDSVPLPAGIALVGIDCGVNTNDVSRKQTTVRVASGIGRRLIDAVIRHEGAGSTGWDGQLSCVSVADYVTRFRDRLPRRLKGSEYLERFGALEDSPVPVESDESYRVRSRTEHHIYEHDRSCRFVEWLRSAREGDETALVNAGDVMYASHWSYGQRCGLGCSEADALVSLLRANGTAQGIYGAKVSGRGCGGIICVLMRDERAAHSALESSVEEYQRRTKRSATVLTGSRPGALVGGVVAG